MMKNEWIYIHKMQPENGQRCLIFHKFKNILGHDGKPDQFDCATFYKGKIKTNNWCFCDVGFSNNEYPWAWKNGAMMYDSQYVDFWMPLSLPPEEN